jgi:hypothetical protein
MRIEAEFLELPTPFGVGIAETFDVDAARETSFDSCLDELRSQKREREGQIDLPHRASLPFGQLCGWCHGGHRKRLARATVLRPLTGSVCFNETAGQFGWRIHVSDQGHEGWWAFNFKPDIG